MNKVTDMEVFVRSVRYGSLSAAARSLGLTPAAVSYRLTKLEGDLGIRLLHRTTRRLVLTQDGAEYLPKAERMLAELEEFALASSRSHELPQGTLKVTVPSSFGRQHIAPLVPQFLERYPSVRMNLILNDEMTDIVAEGMDLAIRICKLKESDLIAQKLAPDTRVICASDRYLKRRGIPRTPQDLAGHNCMALSQQPFWTFQNGTGIERVKVNGNLQCNNGEVLRELAIAGVGIALKATWDVADAIGDGRLKVLLEDYPLVHDTSVWAVYPSRRNLPAKVTSFVHFLKDSFACGPAALRQSPC